MPERATPEGAPAEHAMGPRRGTDPQSRPQGTIGVITPWFAFLGGLSAWVLQFVVSYSIAEIACQTDRLDVVILGLHGPDFFGAALTLLAGATAIAAAIVSLSLFPSGVRADPVDEAGAHETPGRSRFMAYAGLVMNGLFLIIILATGLPFLFLRSCV